MGVVETVRRLRMADHCWDGQARHVAKFIAACPTCQKINVNRAVPKRQQHASVEPMFIGDIVCCDLMGPIHESDGGKRYILVLIDAFSRHVELESLPSKHAEGIADALLRYVSRYGLPTYLRTDGGGEFTASLITDLLDMLGSSRQLVLPYLSRANGVVERANKEVMRHLRPLILGRREPGQWDRYLPFVQRTMNATPHTATGYAPAQLLFGNHFNLNRHLMAGYEPPAQSSTWINDVQKHRDEVNRRVSKRFLDDAKRRRDSSGPPSDFESGEYVLMSYPKNQKPRGKLGAAWRGPYEILRRVGEDANIYEVRHCASGVEMRVSDSRLVTYDADNEVDVREVASTDADEWLVEAVVGHRFSPALKPNCKQTTAAARRALQLRIRWAGTEPSEDSWIDYRGNADLAALTPYLDDHQELGL
jgi:phosphotransferase system IIB component